MNNTKYYVNGGETDRRRMEIINQLYNPITFDFLKESGLQIGMTVLEYGCRVGYSAFELAKYVGASGQVIAIDANADNIKTAQELALKYAINNIKFIHCDTADVSDLKLKFDFMYGRWTLNFYHNPQQILDVLFDNLNNGGVLTYEGTSKADNGFFSYPHESMLERLFQVGIENYEALNLDPYIANKLYYYFSEIGCQNIKLKVNQPILVSPEEKSVMRLTILNSGKLEQERFTHGTTLEQLTKDLINIEQKNTIIGFFRNIIASGIK